MFFSWVDVNSCGGLENIEKAAKFVDLDIPELDKPIMIDDYINEYC
jgi:hypothetical protein